MTFSVFEVETPEQRLHLEAGIIASLHHGEDFAASNSWLGRFSPELEIQNSGMWLKQGLDTAPLTGAELDALEKRLAVTSYPQSSVIPVPDAPSAQTGRKVSTADILDYIVQILAAHQEQRETNCSLISGEIHKATGLSNKMPSVCSAMYQAMEPGDVVVHTTPSGKSSTIQICYQLTDRKFQKK